MGSVVLTRFSEQPAAIAYEKKLKALGLRVYRHYPIEGYPADIPLIVSDRGFGRNDYIETSRPLVVVTAPGPGSGKMATCLSQLYHEHKRGVDAGYAKFETFPIWNLPLNHPVNLAYEAATADLDDVNMIDPFHLDAYGEKVVNYNRDVEVFPVLNAIFEKISGSSPYKSPTDMGVNMVGNCIFDDEAVRAAANAEIIRRYYAAECEARKGDAGDGPILKIDLLMKKAGISPADRPAIAAANIRAEQTGNPAAAMEMADGKILTGRTQTLGCVPPHGHGQTERKHGQAAEVAGAHGRESDLRDGCQRAQGPGPGGQPQGTGGAFFRDPVPYRRGRLQETRGEPDLRASL